MNKNWSRDLDDRIEQWMRRLPQPPLWLMFLMMIIPLIMLIVLIIVSLI